MAFNMANNAKVNSYNIVEAMAVCVYIVLLKAVITISVLYYNRRILYKQGRILLLCQV